MRPQPRDEDPDDRAEDVTHAADEPGAPDGEAEGDDTSQGPGGEPPGPADPDSRDADDHERLWEQIVANYGTAPAWQDPPARRPRSHPEHPAGAGRSASGPDPARERDVPAGSEPANDLQRSSEERFRPPPPPPLPRVTPPRLVAWFGVFGVPVLVLVFLMASVQLPAVVGAGLMFWFVGGFAYLVASMGPRREDPDDGAVL